MQQTSLHPASKPKLKFWRMFFKYFFTENKILQLWLNFYCLGPRNNYPYEVRSFISLYDSHAYFPIFSSMCIYPQILFWEILHKWYSYWTFFFVLAICLFIQHYVSDLCPHWKCIYFDCYVLSYCVNIPTTEGQFGLFLFVHFCNFFSLFQLVCRKYSCFCLHAHVCKSFPRIDT